MAAKYTYFIVTMATYMNDKNRLKTYNTAKGISQLNKQKRLKYGKYFTS